MRKTLLLPTLGTLWLHAACDMQIVSLKNSAERTTLVLKHDKHCEVLLDHNATYIALRSKVYVEMNLTKETNATTAGTDTPVEALISLAKSKLGSRYAPAKAGPDHFDCSGFVYYVFKQQGIKIPRASLSQSQSGEKLTREQLKRGDILFFDTHERKHINHSGIYLGEGKFIHSSSGKAYGVTISDLDKGFYKEKFRWGVRKIEAP